ncbi:MAG TPA: hypothetical protein VJQ42_09640 [Rhodanobacteraceae bacterium]|nr:hypothetical protein [Rhodanobacteraceae bacterium]
MKHVPLGLTVLLLGGLPLTAAAFDYGPNRTLLAAENGAPQLPVLQPRDAPNGAKPEVMTAASAESPSSSESRMASSSASPAAEARPRGPTASNKSRGANPEQPAPGPATWQSLLPGSIQ